MPHVCVPPGTVTLTISTPAYYRDGHFDSCASAEEHLLAPTPEGKDRRTCRVALEDVLPERSRGKKGRWVITARFEEEKC